MGNLVYCPTCGGAISSNAYRCPRCGENDFTEYFTYYVEVHDHCSSCNGSGTITSSYDPLQDQTNLLGNGRHSTYNPVFKKVREQNPIQYTTHTCSRCNGYGYTVRQIPTTGSRDKRLGY